MLSTLAGSVPVTGARHGVPLLHVSLALKIGGEMSRLRKMMEAHPSPAGSNGEAALECTEACFDCAEICQICADACLAEEDANELVQCIRLNLDCSDICDVTGKLIVRTGHRDANTLHLQLHACAQA